MIKEYLLSVIGASLLAALIGILSPKGEGDGIAKHMRLLTSLFLICVLISPIKTVTEALSGWISGEVSFPWEGEELESDYREQMNEAIESASKEYFINTLTETLRTQFSMEAGSVRCQVKWENAGEELRPVRVTVILSGGAIWKNPELIEAFVEELLGCECITAIE